MLLLKSPSSVMAMAHILSAWQGTSWIFPKEFAWNLRNREKCRNIENSQAAVFLGLAYSLECFASFSSVAVLNEEPSQNISRLNLRPFSILSRSLASLPGRGPRPRGLSLCLCQWVCPRGRSPGAGDLRNLRSWTRFPAVSLGKQGLDPFVSPVTWDAASPLGRDSSSAQWVGSDREQ